MKKRIFLVDDDELILESFDMIFSDLDFEVVTCSDSTRAVDIALTSDFDLILSDIRMPGLNGAQAVKKILAGKSEAKIFVLTAYPGDPIVQTAMEAGAQGLMKKPFEVAKILDLLKD